jgi:hypothetical protein
LGENMNITILNGNPDARNATFDDYLARLSDELIYNDHAVTGTVVFWVLDSLDMVIAGGGEVSYFGNPNVTQSITGSGSLTSLDDK